MTLSLWLAYVTSLLGHYFLTSWLPTVLVAAGIPLAHAVIAGRFAVRRRRGRRLHLVLVAGQTRAFTLGSRGFRAVPSPLILLIAFSARVSDFALMATVSSPERA